MKYKSIGFLKTYFIDIINDECNSIIKDICIQNNINEIDIEFTGNLDSSIQFTTHHPGPWSLTEIHELNFNPHLEYHNYAFEWTPTYVKWFIDGIEVYSQNQDIVDDLIHPHKIMMNLWSAIYEDWVGQWDPSSMPVSSFYDYVKYNLEHLVIESVYHQEWNKIDVALRDLKKVQNNFIVKKLLY